MLRTSTASVLLAALLGTAPLAAQGKGVDSPQIQDLKFQIWLDRVRADKKYIVSENLPLTDAEAKDFWPLYDEFQKTLVMLNDRGDKLTLAYLDASRRNSLTDAEAGKFLESYFTITGDETALWKSVVPKLQKILPTVKVLRYLQIENKLRAQTMAAVTDQIPLAK